ncbi:5,6-dimethylbenzimidazole synthase [Sphingomonas morindae]|uniref:5,6-dimethylbenzimidazole synthase n=1 Tax=Sphingomonas morindae TaxID=1541170 RepID=A0ABY4X6K1_9SPHN|nr:5,6-dimethylbenzimidazole synthase [Sphingomonas morindae]USI72554.1 5,6-dimethylbenzimidazole synthase [Sphingomonas morindae]
MTTEAPPAGEADLIAALDRLLRWRRDVRRFRTDPIDPAVMEALLATTAHAPSVGNAQPWRIVRVRSAAARAALRAHVEAETERAAAAQRDAARRARHRALKLHGLDAAPELIAMFSDEAPAAGHGLGIATMREALRYSTVLAVHGLWLAARARGIGLGWVSILRPEAVAALLEVPPEWQLIGLLCLGYPVEEQTRPELERAGWQAREPWRDRVFER